MKILGYNYTIDRSRSNDDIGTFGRHNGISFQIQIASDLTQQQAESTMLHEIIEAINFAMNLELGEHNIRVLEASLYQVLTANGVDLSGLLDGRDKNE